MIVWRALVAASRGFTFLTKYLPRGRGAILTSRDTRAARYDGDFFYLKNLVAIVYSGTVYGVAPDGRTDGRPLFLLFVYELFLLRPGILNLRRAFPYDEDFVVPDLRDRYFRM